MNFSSKKIRSDFVKFFENKKHKFVRSSPVMPIEDPTLLFTNAGMNQFKKIFLNLEQAENKRVVNYQKCIRVSGKHNDLEEVGVDNYHHTFFEMLGNWSFGDFYKKEAIEWSWELLTEVWKLDKKRLWVTVYKDDDEAEELWKKHTDVSHDRVLRFGKKDNFWEMGETGPCGPCSELHYYIGEDILKQNKDGVNSKEEYRELWNLVFIEFNRTQNGQLEQLPEKHVDTGAGLERLVSTLNKNRDHYLTDSFLPIIKKIEKISGKSYDFEDGIPHRVIADHIRMVSFSLADGIMPSNEGRGYVVRRILRRAARFGRVLEIENEFLYTLLDEVINILGESYPELNEKKSHIAKVIQSEETSFGKTLDRGLVVFDEICNELSTNVIPGKDVFKLYDTYGFPYDLTELLAKEKKLKINKDDFNQLMEIQKEKARSSNKFSSGNDSNQWVKYSDNHSSKFIGYKLAESEAKITEYRILDDKIEIVLDQTPFYAESGGQIGDTGKIFNTAFEFIVENTYMIGQKIAHLGCLQSGNIDSIKNINVTAEIDTERRNEIKLNHTGTHLLHKALKIVLGDHVQQAGSLVAPDKLRFDLTHYQKITSDEICKIEEIINNNIRSNIKLDVAIKSFNQAKKEGAEALFGEKYGDEVRVIDIKDFSKELCGGTHVNSTGDIGLLKIILETSLASGVRRIEAITGKRAFDYLSKHSTIINKIKQDFQCDENEINNKIDDIQISGKKLRKEIEELNKLKIKNIISDFYNNKKSINNISILNGKIELSLSPQVLSDVVREKLSTRGIGLVGLICEKKYFLVCSITKDITTSLNAGSIIKDIVNEIGGSGGGGSPHMGTTGFKDIAMLEKALHVGQKLINKICEKYDS